MKLAWLCLALAVAASLPRLARAQDSSASPGADHPRFAVTGRAGALFPLGAQDTTLLLGIVASLEFGRTDALSARLSVDLGFDHARLFARGETVLSPLSWPRSRGELSQRANVYTPWLAARFAVVRAGPIDVDVGGGVGLAFHRGDFEAYGASQEENDTEPVWLARLGVQGTHGAFRWRIEGSMRGTTFDLGDPGRFGEDELYAPAVTGGLGIAF